MGEISEALKRAREGVRPGPDSIALPRRDMPNTHLAPPRDDSSSVTISDEPDESSAARIVIAEPRGDIAEGYRHFAIKLQRELKALGARSVIVTSAARGEGKTTTACNLALALASMSSGRRVALIELDLRRPNVARALGVAVPVGIERVLDGGASVAAACIHTQMSDLDLYLVASAPSDPLARISSTRAAELLRDLARQYDILVIDAPPTLPVPDVPLLAAHADAVLLIARAGSSRSAALRESVDLIGRDRVLGVFLNEARTPLHRRYRGYYGYEESAVDRGADGGNDGS